MQLKNTSGTLLVLFLISYCHRYSSLEWFRHGITITVLSGDVSLAFLCGKDPSLRVSHYFVLTSVRAGFTS